MSTLPNIRKPAELSAEMGKHAKSVSHSQIAICRLFAEAWTSYKSLGWTSAEFREFAVAIFKLGIGPNPEGNLLRMNSEGSYELKSTWQYMNTIGNHEMYEDGDILEACRSSSITNLYELTTLWKAAAKRKNSKNDDPALAKGRVVKFLTQFPDPTREEIAEARNELKLTNRSDPAPGVESSEGSMSHTTTVADLIERGETFDTILITPSDEVWNEIAEASLSDIDEKFGFQELRTPQTSINIVAKGNRATAALKIAGMMGVSNPSVFCILERDIKARVFSLDDITLLVSSANLKAPKEVDKKANSQELVRRMLQGTGRKIQIYGQEEAEGWTTAD